MDKENPSADALCARFQKRARRLPSLETQLLEWFRFLVEHGHQLRTPYHDVCELERSGFKSYVRSGFWRHIDQAYWGFTLAKIEIPPQYRGRGWFRNWLEILYRSMPHDLLVLESVINDDLSAALQKQQAYQLFERNNFVRWDVAKLGEFNPRHFSRTSSETFFQLGGKLKFPDYCRPVVNFPGYKPAMTKARDWANAIAEKKKTLAELKPRERTSP